jgi:hypothetical protein
MSNQLTWEEVEEFGVPLTQLSPGDMFVTVSASNPEGTGLGEYTGKLIYNGVGSSLVQLDRDFDSRIRWAPETKVVKLDMASPKTAWEMRVSHTQFSQGDE